MTNIETRKLENARRTYGSRGASCRMGARWAAYRDGEMIARYHVDDAEYMDRPVWRVYSADGVRELRAVYSGGRAACEKWIAENC